MNTVYELKAVFEAAEKAHRAAYRRAQWLERRLLDAPTEADYNSIAAELDRQEEQLKASGLALTRARYAYAAADLNGTA